METECVNELVNDGEKSEAASVDGMRLQTNALSTANSTDLCRTSNWIASNEYKIKFDCAVNKSNASAVREVASRSVNVTYLVVI